MLATVAPTVAASTTALATTTTTTTMTATAMATGEVLCGPGSIGASDLQDQCPAPPSSTGVLGLDFLGLGLSLRQADSGHTSGRVWEAGLLLASALMAGPPTKGAPCGPPVQELRGRTVIELGAGTGIVSLAAAALGAQVTATDQEVGLLQENLVQNRDAVTGRLAEPVRLQWGNVAAAMELPVADIIFAADVVYEKYPLAPLLTTIRQLLVGAESSAVAILSYTERSSTVTENLHRALSAEDLSFEVQPAACSLPDVEAVPTSARTSLSRVYFYRIRLGQFSESWQHLRNTSFVVK